jgi:uncharacterized protein (TIGR03435 family)
LLITYAYEITENLLESAPEWVRTERFDITAKLPQTTPYATQDRTARLALRTLLSERFKLSLRREAREAAVYALVMARHDRQPGPELKRAAFDCSTEEGRKVRADRIAAGGPPGTCGMNVQPGRIRFGSRSMDHLARACRTEARRLAAPSSIARG